MEDVARAAGVHRTTVSMALRNHRRIPQKTRERIQRIANQMGYQKHPLISALMTYRARHRQPDWQGTLGLLTFGNTRDQWKQPKAYARIAQGMESRAAERGYALDPIWAMEPGLNAARLMQIMRTRMVSGIILTPNISPTENPVQLDLQWDELSTVAIGYSITDPDPHRVASDYFHNLALAYRRCVTLGYRRIGLVLQARADKSVGYLWSASFLNQQRLHPQLAMLPTLILPEYVDARGCLRILKRWLREHRADVFISLPSTIRQYRQSQGKHQLPKGVDWINLGCYEPTEPSSGIYPNYWNIGATAVDFLIAMINRGERGLPRQNNTLLIKGTWIEGDASPVSTAKAGEPLPCPGQLHQSANPLEK